MGDGPRLRRFRYDPMLIAEAMRAVCAGVSIREVACRVGCDDDTVRGWMADWRIVVEPDLSPRATTTAVLSIMGEFG